MNDNNFKEFCEGFDEVLGLIFKIIIIIGFIVTFAVVVGHHLNKDDKVENTKIDIIEAKSDSIKLEVKQLDSIKNAKVIEVEGLDNDSTVKLFYKLIK